MAESHNERRCSSLCRLCVRATVGRPGQDGGGAVRYGSLLDEQRATVAAGVLLPPTARPCPSRRVVCFSRPASGKAEAHPQLWHCNALWALFARACPAAAAPRR